MEDRTRQFRVGVVVFATIIITVLLIMMNSDFSWSPFRNQYQLQVLVDQAPGVAPDTPVRRRGILIGRVDSVEDTDTGALITVNIDEGKNVKTNEIARIQTSLIGDAVIEFTPGPAAGAQIVKPGGPPRPGMYNPSPLDLIANLQGDLKQTIQSLGRAGDEVAQLAERLNSVMGGQDIERIDRLMLSTESAMNNFSSVMDNLDDIVGDEEFKTQLKNGLAQLPSLVTDAREFFEVLQQAMGGIKDNLENLEGFTGPLGERGPDIVESMESSIYNLGEMLGEGALFAKALNNREGTLGRLLNEREVYDQIRDTITEATATIRDVRKVIRDPEIHRRIRQILADVRVFADKIARDPARITRGVIPRNRETPLK